jgi:hypothetical protein
MEGLGAEQGSPTRQAATAVNSRARSSVVELKKIIANRTMMRTMMAEVRASCRSKARAWVGKWAMEPQKSWSCVDGRSWELARGAALPAYLSLFIPAISARLQPAACRSCAK